MAGALGYFAKRRKEDIELPNTSGRTDERLRKPGSAAQFGQAAEGLRYFQQAIKGLDKASKK